jgi:hypothetical protein
MVLRLESRASKRYRYGALNKGTLECKIAGAGFHFFAELRAQKFSADHGKPQYERREDWHTAV